MLDDKSPSTSNTLSTSLKWLHSPTSPSESNKKECHHFDSTQQLNQIQTNEKRFNAYIRNLVNYVAKGQEIDELAPQFDQLVSLFNSTTKIARSSIQHSLTLTIQPISASSQPSDNTDPHSPITVAKIEEIVLRTVSKIIPMISPVSSFSVSYSQVAATTSTSAKSISIPPPIQEPKLLHKIILKSKTPGLTAKSTK